MHYGPPYLDDSELPNIKIVMNCGNLQPSLLKATVRNEHIIVIGDIKPAVNNKGHGTQMLQLLIKYAKKHKYQKVTGWISGVDLEHIDRLKHFYGKFGFSIKKYRGEDPIREYDLNLKL